MLTSAVRVRILHIFEHVTGHATSQRSCTMSRVKLRWGGAEVDNVAWTCPPAQCCGTWMPGYTHGVGCGCLCFCPVHAGSADLPLNLSITLWLPNLWHLLRECQLLVLQSRTKRSWMEHRLWTVHGRTLNYLSPKITCPKPGNGAATAAMDVCTYASDPFHGD